MGSNLLPLSIEGKLNRNTDITKEWDQLVSALPEVDWNNLPLCNQNNKFFGPAKPVEKGCTNWLLQDLLQQLFLNKGPDKKVDITFSIDANSNYHLEGLNVVA